MESVKIMLYKIAAKRLMFSESLAKEWVESNLDKLSGDIVTIEEAKKEILKLSIDFINSLSREINQEAQKEKNNKKVYCQLKEMLLDSSDNKTKIDISSKEHLKTIKQDWERIAKEPVEVEYYANAFWGFCSELASLRLFHEYYCVVGAITGYSKSLDTFYFKVESKSN